jgi:hypothetical protein
VLGNLSHALYACLQVCLSPGPDCRKPSRCARQSEEVVKAKGPTTLSSSIWYQIAAHWPGSHACMSPTRLNCSSRPSSRRDYMRHRRTRRLRQLLRDKWGDVLRFISAQHTRSNAGAASGIGLSTRLCSTVRCAPTPTYRDLYEVCVRFHVGGTGWPGPGTHHDGALLQHLAAAQRIHATESCLPSHVSGQHLHTANSFSPWTSARFGRVSGMHPRSSPARYTPSSHDALNSEHDHLE